MNTPRGLRRARPFVTATAGAALVGLLLTGCGGDQAISSAAQGADTASSRAGGPAPSGSARKVGAVSATASASATRSAATGGETLPPGDPGADAPGTDDPNAAAADSDPGSTRSGRPSRRPSRTAEPVDAGALLDASTLGSITGTTWSLTAVVADSCAAPRPRRPLARRSTAFAGGGAGDLVETVATYVDRAAAVAVVGVLRDRLAGCGGAPIDPRVGDASVQATLTSPDGSSTLVTAMAAEGVVAVLAGTGKVTAEDVWPSVTDLALGNTCAAATDGCH